MALGINLDGLAEKVTKQVDGSKLLLRAVVALESIAHSLGHGHHHHHEEEAR